MYKHSRASLIALLVTVHLSVSARVSPGEFLKEFVKDPSKIGAPAECAPRVAREMVQHIKNSGHATPRSFLEVGPGDGNITRELEPLLSAQDSLVLIEFCKPFADNLSRRYAGKSNITVHHGSITDYLPAKKFHHIVCTIPFYTLSLKDVKKVLALFESSLEDEGTISFVEFSVFGRFNCKVKEWGTKTKRTVLNIFTTQPTSYENTATLLDQFMKKFAVERKEIPNGCGGFTIYVYNLKKVSI